MNDNNVLAFFHSNCEVQFSYLLKFKRQLMINFLVPTKCSSESLLSLIRGVSQRSVKVSICNYLRKQRIKRISCNKLHNESCRKWPRLEESFFVIHFRVINSKTWRRVFPTVWIVSWVSVAFESDVYNVSIYRACNLAAETNWNSTDWIKLTQITFHSLFLSLCRAERLGREVILVVKPARNYHLAELSHATSCGGAQTFRLRECFVHYVNELN